MNNSTQCDYCKEPILDKYPVKIQVSRGTPRTRKATGKLDTATFYVHYRCWHEDMSQIIKIDEEGREVR